MDFIVRPIDLEKDIAEVHQIRLQPDVMKYILSVPSEQIETISEKIYSAVKTSHTLVAEATHNDGRKELIGFVFLYLDENKRRRHCGSIGIFVSNDYFSKGVGSKLMETILNYADNYLMLVRVELCVVSTNFHAIALYEKYGFVKEGLLHKASITNGSYVDEFFMSRINDNF